MFWRMPVRRFLATWYSRWDAHLAPSDARTQDAPRSLQEIRVSNRIAAGGVHHVHGSKLLVYLCDAESSQDKITHKEQHHTLVGRFSTQGSNAI